MSTFTNAKLAEGQLAASKTTIYTVPASTKLIGGILRLFNTNTTQETVNVYFKTATSRQVMQVILDALEFFEFSFPRDVLEASDLIEADTTTASKVDYWLSGVKVT